MSLHTENRGNVRIITHSLVRAAFSCLTGMGYVRGGAPGAQESLGMACFTSHHPLAVLVVSPPGIGCRCATMTLVRVELLVIDCLGRLGRLLWSQKAVSRCAVSNTLYSYTFYSRKYWSVINTVSILCSYSVSGLDSHEIFVLIFPPKYLWMLHFTA